MKEYDEFIFPNGIRVVHRQVSNTKIAHCGFILNIGSRDEKPDQQGIAHFWEHMAFKGTKKRKAYHILSRVDSVGGELNAYTTKEKICFYASLLDNHFEKAVELISDITFHSIFPEKEIKKERGVILEEMAMYKDDPGDAIQDEFDAVVFKNHSLGYNILGTQESVKSFSKENFHQFILENLNTDEVIFSSVSALPFKKVLKVAQKYFSNIPTFKSKRKRHVFNNFKPEKVIRHKPISQAHCITGTTSFSIHDPRRIPFFLLVNLLGGPGMNSRLNLSIREKYGFVYGIDASVTAYQDTGLFLINFATEQKTLEKCVQLLMKELKKLRETPLGSMQLHQAKQQMIGQLAISEESNLGFMLMMGKSILDLGRVETLNEVLDKINKVTASDILDLANIVFPENRLSMLTYLPE